MKNWCKRASDLFFCIAFLICLSALAFGQNMFRKVNDFDGDGKADFAVTRNVGGYKYWYILQSSQGLRIVQWGINSDENTAGDYDGDGKFDPAVFRQSHSGLSGTYTFWISGSQSGTRVVDWTTNSYANVVAHHQDYDGDGKTDVAYTWGDSGDRTRCLVWYSASDRYPCDPQVGPLVKLGDVTGDGKADFAGVQENTNQNIVKINDSGNSNTQSIPFGISGDKSVAADFDGDGKGDLAIFRESNGTWWWKRSSDGVVNAAQFGQAGDKPVPADYDGDGKTDIAIWRPGSQGAYWVNGSQSGVFGAAWGMTGDSAVTY